ncbi:MAG: hypothetical protein JO281_12325 [Pseudonocardiales bacterium]|nr:hypothetical protein [Pseudonocardiales bacterium]
MKGVAVKFILLIQTNADRWKVLARTEKENFLAAYISFNQKIIATGEHLDSAVLDHREKSLTVRVRDGKVNVTDGPFSDAKDGLSGYYLVDVESVERAVEIAAEIPDAQFNAIEVRSAAVVPGL